MAIEISTPEQFIAIKDWTERGTADAPLDIVITQDLDFSQTDLTDWTGQGDATLYANIDGQGYSIKNMVISVTSDFYLLPFLRQGSLKNLNIDNCHISTISTSYVYVLYYYQINVVNFLVKGNCVFIGGGADTRGIICCPYPNAGTSIFTNVSVSGEYRVLGSNSGSVFYCYKTNLRYCNINVKVYGSTDHNIYIIGCASVVMNTFVRGSVSAGSIVVFNVDELDFCYAAILANTTGTNRFSAKNSINSAFYDKNLMTTSDSEYGQPTENLKNAEWLRAQGLAI